MLKDNIGTQFHRFQKVNLTEQDPLEQGVEISEFLVPSALLHRVQPSVERPEDLRSIRHQRKHLIRSLAT